MDDWQEEKVCEIFVKNVISEDRWRNEIKTDLVLQRVISKLESGFWPKSVGSDDMKPFWNIKEELSVNEDILFRGTRLIPPSSMRAELMSIAHESHQGISKTKESLRGTYWWPGMDVAVERVVRECMLCALSEKANCSRTEPMVIRSTPNEPWSEILLDLTSLGVSTP